MRGIASRVSQKIGILRLVKFIFVDTSALLHSYFAFVLPILEYRSPVWGSAAERHLLLLERQVYSVARLCADQSSLCHRRCEAWHTNSNTNHCLYSELLSAYSRVRHTRQLIHWSLKYHGVERPNLHGLSCRLIFEFDTGMLDEFKGAVNGWLLP